METHGLICLGAHQLLAQLCQNLRPLCIPKSFEVVIKFGISYLCSYLVSHIRLDISTGL